MFTSIILNLTDSRSSVTRGLSSCPKKVKIFFFLNSDFLLALKYYLYFKAKLAKFYQNIKFKISSRYLK